MISNYNKLPVQKFRVPYTTHQQSGYGSSNGGNTRNVLNRPSWFLHVLEGFGWRDYRGVIAQMHERRFIWGLVNTLNGCVVRKTLMESRAKW